MRFISHGITGLHSHFLIKKSSHFACECKPLFVKGRSVLPSLLKTQLLTWSWCIDFFTDLVNKAVGCSSYNKQNCFWVRVEYDSHSNWQDTETVFLCVQSQCIAHYICYRFSFGFFYIMEFLPIFLSECSKACVSSWIAVLTVCSSLIPSRIIIIRFV